MHWKPAMLVILLTCSLAGLALGDELTQIVQQDLTTLGYDTGGVTGTAGTRTIIAVSRFQAEHNLEVTGEITPQLAGVIKAAISKQGTAANADPGPDALQRCAPVLPHGALAGHRPRRLPRHHPSNHISAG